MSLSGAYATQGIPAAHGYRLCQDGLDPLGLRPGDAADEGTGRESPDGPGCFPDAGRCP
jgi:hypothetical protein